MLLVVEILFIVLLAMVFFMLYRRERSSARHLLPQATVEEFWTGKERRGHVRFSKNLEVNYVVEKKPHLKSNGKTVDISEGGMKLLLGEKLAKGTILDLMIELPDSKVTAEVEGAVVWSEDASVQDASGKRYFHSGIKFSAIKEPAGKRLIDYVRTLSK